MKRILTICLILILAVSAAALADETAVRVNGRAFSVAEVQKYIDETAEYMKLVLGIDLNEVYPADAHQDFLRQAAEHFVTLEVMNGKLREANSFALSAEEEASLREYARTQYDEIWEEFNARVAEGYPDLEDPERYTSQVIESAGYSMDGIFEQAVQALRQQRLVELYCGDISVSDEEVRTYYEENVVAPDREKYADDLDLFEQEVLLGGGSSAYMPEGYTYIKYIVLDPKEESMDAITAAEVQLAECAKNREDAYDALAVGALEGGDLDELRSAYQAAQDAESEAQSALDAAVETAEQDYLPIWKVVSEALNAGETFEEQMQKYSVDTEMMQESDDGYPFHAESKIWDAYLREAVQALTAEGEITQPVYATAHVYIVCRMKDLPGGAYAFSDEEAEKLKEGILHDKQTEHLDALAQEWSKDAEIEIDLSGLEFPQD